MSILARRIADWESIVSQDYWSELLDKAFELMSRWSSTPLQPEAKKYFALRVCAALDPGSRQPAWFILDKSLYTDLVSDGFFMLRKALGKTMWWSRLGTSISQEMSDAVVHGAPWFFQSDHQSSCARALGAIDPSDIGGNGPYKLVSALYAESGVAFTIDSYVAYRKLAMPMTYRMQQFPLGFRIKAKILGPGMTLFRIAIQAWRVEGLRGFKKLWLKSRMIVEALRIGGASYVMSTSHEDDFSKNLDQYDLDESQFVANDIINRLESRGLADTTHVTEVCRIMLRNHQWGCWYNSISTLVSNALEEAIKAEMTTRQNTIILVEAGEASNQVGIATFHNRILEHVNAYAERVQKNQLDSATLVCTDVVDAMSRVWESMPDGFGTKITHPTT